jgi:hypothetical protein
MDLPLRMDLVVLLRQRVSQIAGRDRLDELPSPADEKRGDQLGQQRLFPSIRSMKRPQTHSFNFEHLPPGMLLVPLVLLTLAVDVLQGPLHIVLVAKPTLVLLPRGEVIIDGDVAVLACPLLA